MLGARFGLDIENTATPWPPGVDWVVGVEVVVDVGGTDDCCCVVGVEDC